MADPEHWLVLPYNSSYPELGRVDPAYEWFDRIQIRHRRCGCTMDFSRHDPWLADPSFWERSDRNHARFEGCIQRVATVP